MYILVALTGLLALASGAIKLLGKGKTLPGVPILAVMEILAGMAVPFLALTRRPPPGQGFVLLGFCLVVVFLSTAYQVFQTRARRRHRLSTEDARLYTYVKYLAMEAQEPPSPEEGKEAP